MKKFLPVITLTSLTILIVLVIFALNKNSQVNQPPLTNLNQENNLKNLEIKQAGPNIPKYNLKSLGGDLVEIGTEKPVNQNKPVGIFGIPLIKVAKAAEGGPKPYLKLNKWDSEASLKVNIPYETTDYPEKEGNKLIYQANNKSIEFYSKEPEDMKVKDSKGTERSFKINEEGGVEFDVILKEKPDINTLEFPLDTTNLDFFYQPPLNQEPQEPGLTCTETECKDKDNNIVNFRPENVVGSYAVYHKDKSGDFSKMGGKNYKAGKAFHIYRPKITDAKGNTTWGSLSIKNNILTVSIPDDFLNSTTYPVRVDPNFGYESVGGSYDDNRNTIMGSLFTGVAGTCSSITAYVWSFGPPSSNSQRAGLYLHSDLSLIGFTDATTPGGGWTTMTFASPPTISSTDYIVFSHNQRNSYTVGFYYDNGSANQGHYQSYEYWGGAWLTPLVPTHNTNKYSIYATYTASATPTPTPTPTPAPAINFSGVNMSGVCAGGAACPTVAPAPDIVFDAASSAQSASDVPSISWNHAIGSGSNRILVVGVQTYSVAVSSVTYNGAALSSIGSIAQNGSNSRVEMWKLLEANMPAAGTYSIVVTFASNSKGIGGATSWKNVNQTTSAASLTTNTGSASPISVNVTSTSGEVVLDAVNCSGIFCTISVDASQTERWNRGPVMGLRGGGSSKTTATSTMSWTITNSPDAWSSGSVVLKHL